MRGTLLLAALVGINTLSAQQTITSTGNGNASNPFTWDCLCFPTSDDDIIINHNVKMDVDWLVNNGGSITVNGNASLVQLGTHSILFDQGGSNLLVQPNGWFEMENLSFTNAATFQNDGTTLVHNAMYVAPSCQATNNATFGMVDSLLVEGVLSNNGVFGAGNVLITGQGFNSGTMDLDSLGVTGSLTSSAGNFWLTAFGNSGTTTLNDTYIVSSGNFYNTENLITNTAFQLDCHGSFYSGDTIGATAFAMLNGKFVVDMDFGIANQVDGSGTICIGGVSTNVGTINGSLNICDNSSAGLDYNFGTIANTVTFCSPGCYVTVEEWTKNWTISPNPSEGLLKLEGVPVGSQCTILAMDGRVVEVIEFQGENIDCSHLNSGFYQMLVQFGSQFGTKSIAIK